VSSVELATGARWN